MRTLRVSEPKIVANDATLASAEDNDVVAGGHRGDDAAAPGGVPFEGIDGEQAPAAASPGVHGDGRGIGIARDSLGFTAS